MSDPIHFHFCGMPASRAAEAAARRRARTLRGAHPDVVDWQVEVTAPAPLDGAAAEYGAQVQARIASGAALQAHGRGADALAALRLAFNQVEARLDAEREGVHARASRWLSAVRSRIGQRQHHA